MAQTVAQEFHVPRHTNDWRALLAADLDAALLCHTGEIASPPLRPANTLYRKAMQEADRIIAAQQAAGTVGLAGYMKVYDPAFDPRRR